MSVKEFKLPTIAVDNSVDYACATALTIGFYYIFVKMVKIAPAYLFFVFQWFMKNIELCYLPRS